jgi:hypothetical protein
MLPLNENLQLEQKGESLILPLTNLPQTESVLQQKLLLDYTINNNNNNNNNNSRL